MGGALSTRIKLPRHERHGVVREIDKIQSTSTTIPEPVIGVADEPWASLLPELLLDILQRLETTAVVRCAAVCKPWRRIIISNATILQPRPDRYNPNLLLGFIRSSWYTTAMNGNVPPPPAIIKTAVDTWCCDGDRLSSLLPPVAAYSGGNGLSLCCRTLASRDGFLLLRCCHRSYHDGLCLYNPITGDCKFLAVPPIMEQYGEYVLVTGDDHSPTETRKDGIRIRILAMPGPFKVCDEEGRLTYQLLSYGDDDGTAVWGPVQHSAVNKALLMLDGASEMVVGRDAVHWLGETRDVHIACTVGLDVYTGRTWTTDLPRQCRFYNSSTALFELITSGDGRLSLLQQQLPDHHIQVWVLDVANGGAMEWTMKHKIWIDKKIYPDVVACQRSDLGCNYPNVICPRSGLLFIMLSNRLQLRIDLESRACQPVQSIDNGYRPNRYYPYEMDWSTYLSKLKNF